MTDDEPTTEELLTYARNGDIESLSALCDVDGDGLGDILAYTWLNVAADFGHEEADSAIDFLLEATSLRYDDDQSVTGGVHFDLGVAYLTGRDGLPADHDKARVHLQSAAERNYPEGIQDGDTLVARTRTALAGDARAVFAESYPER